MTPEDLEALGALVLSMEASAAAGDPFPDQDAEFHRRLYAPLDNALLAELMDVFWRVYRQIAAEVGPSPASTMEIAAQHRAILDAVAAGDAQLAASRLGAHFGGLRTSLAAHIARTTVSIRTQPTHQPPSSTYPWRKL
jgi:DNA-binding GntR family transcriptional regulator